MPKQPEDIKAVRSCIDFAYVVIRCISWLLAKGEYEGHPYEGIPGELKQCGGRAAQAAARGGQGCEISVSHS